MVPKSAGAALALALLAALAAAAAASTDAAPVTYGRGPSCLPHNVTCRGTAELELPCCNPDKVACMQGEGTDVWRCSFKNEKCLETTSRCDDSDKQCCDKDAVCRDVLCDDGKTSKGKFCERTCALDDHRCEGAAGYPYVRTMPCCNPNYVCKVTPGGLWGKFCSPP